MLYFCILSLDSLDYVMSLRAVHFDVWLTSTSLKQISNHVYHVRSYKGLSAGLVCKFHEY